MLSDTQILLKGGTGSWEVAYNIALSQFKKQLTMYDYSSGDIIDVDVSWFLRQLLREGIINKSSLKRKEFLHANSLRQRI